MRELSQLLASGGWVSWALVMVSVLMWALVWLRGMALRGTLVKRFIEQARQIEPARLENALGRAVQELEAWKGQLQALVVIAPLLGLLGTVGGMIELFDSLHGSGRVGEGSVAGGISRALVTTQLGLIIGAPGLVAARLLNRRQLRRTTELRQVVDANRKEGLR